MPKASVHHVALAHHFPNLEEQKEATSLGMWVFLATEVMFFGGLFLAYCVYRSLYPVAFAAGSRHLDVTLGAINTAILICSSLTMALAVHAAALNRRYQIVFFLILTILLGTAFLGIKVKEYEHKFDPAHYLVPGRDFNGSVLGLTGVDTGHAQIFYFLYFAMTGLHATHMIIGIPIMGIVAILAARGRFSSAYHAPVELTGLYWHFVDIVWIFLFPLLYLIGGHTGSLKGLALS